MYTPGLRQLKHFLRFIHALVKGLKGAVVNRAHIPSIGHSRESIMANLY